MSAKYTLTCDVKELRDLFYSLTISTFFMHRLSGKDGHTPLDASMHKLMRKIEGSVSSYGGGAADAVFNPAYMPPEMTQLMETAGMMLGIVDEGVRTQAAMLKKLGQPLSPELEFMMKIIESARKKRGKVDSLDKILNSIETPLKAPPHNPTSEPSDVSLEAMIDELKKALPPGMLKSAKVLKLDELDSPPSPAGVDSLLEKLKKLKEGVQSGNMSDVPGLVDVTHLFKEPEAKSKEPAPSDKLGALLQKLKTSSKPASKPLSAESLFGDIAKGSTPTQDAGFSDSITAEINALLAAKKKGDEPPATPAAE